MPRLSTSDHSGKIEICGSEDGGSAGVTPVAVSPGCCSGILYVAMSGRGPNPPERVAGRARQLCPAFQTSIFSAISSASSTSTPR